MSSKRKVITIICLVLGLIVCIGAGILIFTAISNGDSIGDTIQNILDVDVNDSDSDEDDADDFISKLPEPVVKEESESSGDKDEQKKPQYSEQDRTLKFDTYIQPKDEGKFYKLDKDKEDAGIEGGFVITQSGSNIDFNPEEDTIVNHNGFSNGFITYPTDNISVGWSTGVSTTMYGSDDSEITVLEDDAKTTNIAELREEQLKYRGFGDYLYYKPKGIPINSDFILGNGLKDYKNFFDDEEIPYDPTMAFGQQLIVDDVIKTAYGDCTYLVFYFPDEERFEVTCWISADGGDRIIDITIISNEYKKLWSYIVELTNDGLVLIK